jgi:F-type H+-transporting ATPase subunit epsilon
MATNGKLKLTVTTPERLALERDVDFVALPAAKGEMGVLPGHIPYLTQLTPGALRYVDGSTSEVFAISGGFAEVKRESVSVFAETAEMSEEIDSERARQALEKAKADSKRRDLDPMTLFQAEAAARRAAVRLRVAELKELKKAKH